jgi:hypothetical protein
MACNEGELYFLHVDDVRTSRETHLWTSTVCCGDSFTFYDVRTLQETHLWASTAYYGDIFILLYWNMCASFQ